MRPYPGGYTVLADRHAAAVTALGLQPVLFPMAETEDVPCLLPLVDGVLLTGSPSNVNSLHGQGIKRPGEGLLAVAQAPDGLVEGVRVLGAPAFADACREHRAARGGP